MEYLFLKDYLLGNFVPVGSDVGIEFVFSRKIVKKRFSIPSFSPISSYVNCYKKKKEKEENEKRWGKLETSIKKTFKVVWVKFEFGKKMGQRAFHGPVIFDYIACLKFVLLLKYLMK
jgi:hypothetical protein